MVTIKFRTSDTPLQTDGDVLGDGIAAILDDLSRRVTGDVIPYGDTFMYGITDVDGNPIGTMTVKNI